MSKEKTEQFASGAAEKYVHFLFEEASEDLRNQIVCMLEAATTAERRLELLTQAVHVVKLCGDMDERMRAYRKSGDGK